MPYIWPMGVSPDTIEDWTDPFMVGLRNIGFSTSPWLYKRTLTDSNSTAVTDFQVEVDLTSSNFNFSHAKSDGSDIRFKDANTGLFLPYWIESWDATAQTAIIWVRVADMTHTLDMYYGNPTATTTADGDATFILFDHFPGVSLDLTKWVVKAGTPAVGSSLLTLNSGNASFEYIDSVASYQYKAVKYRANFQRTTASVQYGGITKANNYVVFEQLGADVDNSINAINNNGTDKKTVVTLHPVEWETLTDLPAARADGSTAVYNGLIYYFGGFTKDDNLPHGDVYAYDPVANTWATKTSMPTAVWGHLSIYHPGTGLIYCFGGTNTLTGALNIMQIYDPVGDSWAAGSVMPYSIHGMCGFYRSSTGLIHIIGGYDSSVDVKYHFTYNASTDTYDTTPADLLTAAFYPSCGVVNDKIYVLGGRAALNPTNKTQVYDFSLNSWSNKTVAPASRFGTGRESVAFGNNVYYTHGNAGSEQMQKTVYKYDTVNDIWYRLYDATLARDGIAIANIGGYFYAIGGRSPSVSYQRNERLNLNLYNNTYYTDWYNYSLLWVSGTVKYYIDNVLKATHTQNVPTQSAPMELAASQNKDFQIDWTFVRSCAATEPAIVVGAEAFA